MWKLFLYFITELSNIHSRFRDCLLLSETVGVLLDEPNSLVGHDLLMSNCLWTEGEWYSFFLKLFVSFSVPLVSFKPSLLRSFIANNRTALSQTRVFLSRFPLPLIHGLIYLLARGIKYGIHHFFILTVIVSSNSLLAVMILSSCSPAMVTWDTGKKKTVTKFYINKHLVFKTNQFHCRFESIQVRWSEKELSENSNNPNNLWLNMNNQSLWTRSKNSLT